MRDFFDALAPFGPARALLSTLSASPSVPPNEPSWHAGASQVSQSGASISLAPEGLPVVRSSRPEGSAEAPWPRPLRKAFAGLAHVSPVWGVALAVLTAGVFGGWWFARSGPPESAAALPITTLGVSAPLQPVTPTGAAAAAPADAAPPPNVERPLPVAVGQAEGSQGAAPDRATPLSGKAQLAGRALKRSSLPAPPPAVAPNDASVAAPAASGHAVKAPAAATHHLLPVDDSGPNGASSKHHVFE